MIGSSFRRCALALAVVLALSANARGSDFFVSPSGTADGDGTKGNPWSLAFALSQPAAVKPGDTIWLRAGTYQGTFTSALVGTADAPIIVRSYLGERAIIDGGNSNGVVILTVAGSYTWYWGFEIMSSDLNRVSTQATSWPTDIGRGGGIGIAQTSTTGAGLKFINLIVHDTAGGFGLWKEAIGAEVYGCLIYYNGWTGPDRAHGHGIYTQNQTGTQRIADNLIFSNFDHGIQAYGTAAAPLNNIDIEGNTIFDNGMPGYERNVLLGGGAVAQSPRLTNNALYYPGTSGQNLNVGYDPYGAGAANPVITGNYIVNGDNLFSPLDTNVTMTGNSFYSTVYPPIPAQYPSNIYSSSRPGTPQVFVRANQYEPGRTNITVFNWGNTATVSVDLSSILPVGAIYEIRNAEDYFRGPVATGNFDGSPIGMPMTGLSVAAPMGFDSPPFSSDFHVFVLRWRPPMNVDRPTVKPVGSRNPSVHRGISP